MIFNMAPIPAMGKSQNYKRGGQIFCYQAKLRPSFLFVYKMDCEPSALFDLAPTLFDHKLEDDSVQTTVETDLVQNDFSKQLTNSCEPRSYPCNDSNCPKIFTQVLISNNS